MTGSGLHSLPLFHRIAGQPVIVVGDGPMAEAKRRLVARAGGLCRAENETDAADARIAFVAVDDEAVATAAAARLKARGLLVNVADRPELCDFTLPSILERGEVLLAVSTGGASAGLAKHLRLRLEGILPPSVAALATALKNARAAIRARWPDAGGRRQAIDAALSENGPLDPLRSASDDRVSQWLAAGTDAPLPLVDTIEIVLTSCDPDDLTLRQARWLGVADTAIHDADVPPAILNRLRADCRRIAGTGSPAPADGVTVRIRRVCDQTSLPASLPSSSK